MNIRKITAAFAAAALAASAMAVSAFAEVQVKVEDSGELQGFGAAVLAQDITNDGVPYEGAPDDMLFFDAILPEDVITVTVTSDADTSDWFIALLGADINDEGLMGVYSEFGGLTVTATLQQLLDANGFDYEDIYSIVLLVDGPEDDEVYTVSYKITGESAEESAPDEGGAPAAGGTAGPGADPSKGTPDTGVEGVAVVAGIAIVAAGAIVVAKKRG